MTQARPFQKDDRVLFGILFQKKIKIRRKVLVNKNARREFENQQAPPLVIQRAGPVWQR